MSKADLPGPDSVVCPYCGAAAQLMTGADMYPHRSDLAGKRFWVCRPCGAHVGCHDGTCQPFGGLANGQLRRARMEAHRSFDRIWNSGSMSRGDAYLWLADQLGIAVDQCHIGMMDVAMCQAVVGICT